MKKIVNTQIIELLNILQHPRLKILHLLDGTTRFAEPVSNNTLKVWGGVPILTVP